MSYLLEVEINAEGNKLAYLGKGNREDGYTDGGCYRIAGPKAWGGSRNIARLEISEHDMTEFIKCYAPELVEQLKAPNDRVEGRDAALSRRVPSHDGLCGNGSEVGAGDTAKKGKR